MQKIVYPLTVLRSARLAANRNLVMYSTKCLLRKKNFDFPTKVIVAALFQLL